MTRFFGATFLTARRIIFISACLIFLTCVSYFYAKKKSDYIDFDVSMTDRPIVYGVHSTPEAEKEWMLVLKNLYDKNHFTGKDYFCAEYKIPNIVHHIWLGSQIPHGYKIIRESWFDNHPGWIFKLWVDSEVETFGLENQKFYDIARNYGEKSDVFRYEILKRYGGTYSDTDVLCLKPLKVLHHAHDFYTGIMNAGEVLVAIGLIGSAPNHPFLDAVINGIEDKGSKYDTVNIMERTGPIHFTKVFVKVAPTLPGNIIAYPATYFYPVPNLIRGKACQENAHKYIKAESFTVHYWECSWMRPEAFIMNDALFNQEVKNEYFHKNGVDKFIDEHFENKKNGVFLDINCTDSNENNVTLFFEKNRNWSGICTQPNMKVFKRIANSRNSFCTSGTIKGDYVDDETKIYSVEEILGLCKFEKIDLLCVESTNCYDIIKEIDFNKTNVNTICIKSDDFSKISYLLLSSGFKLIKKIDQYSIFAKES